MSSLVAEKENKKYQNCLLVKFLFLAQAWSPSRHFGRLPGIPKQLHALLFLVSVKYLLWCKNHGHSLEPISKMGIIYVSSENEI